MQELSAEHFSIDEETEGKEEDMADDAENEEEDEMAALERGTSLPRSIEEMAEDISRTPPHTKTVLLSPPALAEQRMKSPPTCKSHTEQPMLEYPPLSTSTA